MARTVFRRPLIALLFALSLAGAGAVGTAVAAWRSGTPVGTVHVPTAMRTVGDAVAAHLSADVQLDRTDAGRRIHPNDGGTAGLAVAVAVVVAAAVGSLETVAGGHRRLAGLSTAASGRAPPLHPALA